MKLLILDGNSVINRAYYGVRPLTTRDGFYTNAIYGFLNILQHVTAEERPDALCVAFDLRGPTFRHLQYAGYKATRHGMDEELTMQMPVMKDVLRAMHIPIYECQGWEADDVIGTVSRRCCASGWDCVILTGDRDSLQLVNDCVTVKLVRTQGGQTQTTNYTPEVFQAEYGMEPLRLIDLKALMGDSSDNIPGVAGVGPKTATGLLQKYGTLDGVYENLTPQNMKGKLYEKLEKGRENAYLSYELATIRCNAPVEFSPEDALVREPDRKALHDLFVRLEFQKLIDRYGLRGAQQQTQPAQPTTLPDRNAWEEPASLSRAQEVTAALCSGEPAAVLFSQDLALCAVKRAQKHYLFSREALGGDYEAALAGLLRPEVKKQTHDLKTLLHLLLCAHLPVEGFVFDTALAAYVLDATRGDYRLETLAAAYASASVPEDASPREGLLCRVCVLETLSDILRTRLREQDCESLYMQVELPLCRVLAQMECDGVAVDQAALHEFGTVLAQRIADCERYIFDVAGASFNINSPRQLGELLFERLGLPPVKKTKSGYSTNADVLAALQDKHPVIPAIMDYRMLTKLKSTYADGLEKEIAADGRIHTTFQNMVTATGRLSSTEPNLQNIPVRTELGAQIRKMFVPRPGWVLVDADYSQIELRVLAHIADDRAMQAAFRSGEDVHAVTASQVFGVPLEAVTPEMRRHAKAVNFGIVYGISEFALAQDIGVSRAQAKEYMESYMGRYAGVKQYKTDIVAFARETGYVQTMYHRRRVIPDIRSTNFNVRSAAERIALNAPIQGTAADIIKEAMVAVFRALEEQQLQARLILQVHDELIVECPAYEAPVVMELVTAAMEQAAALSVPLTAEAKMGESWYAAK